ncbi:hypothetical protein LTR64_003172 [Lithohypha guttulata]|uniref:uncharacterized protein n=1 Tax=Lithohypha guttulata TaxID=1690604 RepID=UPI00315D2E29
MASLPTISIASITTGFISFFFTILTWLGVYVGLLKTLRSAPKDIPLTLSNLRQEIQSERAMLRERLKEGDRYHVFPGRQMRRVGKNESHVGLLDTTLKQTWKNFRELEKAFITQGHGVDGDEDVEGEVRSNDGNSQFSDVERKYEGEKSGHASSLPPATRRARDRARMRRRESHVTNRMGMWEAGLSLDRTTYYNTDLWHRVVWWWRRDDINSLNESVQRLQIRRIEWDMLETNALVRRGLAMIGSMSGEDPYHDCGERKGPQGKGPNGGSSVRTRRSQGVSRNGRAGNRSRELSRNGFREIYEKEIRRTRRRSASASSESPSPTQTPSPMAKVAGSITRTRSQAGPRRQSRALSVVEYEVVNPGPRARGEKLDSERQPAALGPCNELYQRASRFREKQSELKENKLEAIQEPTTLEDVEMKVKEVGTYEEGALTFDASLWGIYWKRASTKLLLLSSLLWSLCLRGSWPLS